MYLQKLDIQGFKSFAPKTTLVFPQEKQNGKGITAIVGPNGSGKSNIADAIRWVMGEQSMKLLRSKHSEDVIFFGSDKKSQLGFCEVSLYFNNEDRVFPIDFPEVVITRRLYRTGESEYCINKNKVRLADVTLLLAQAQFGQRSYSVIGQGLVDHIVQMPPAERKDFFIEAAGVRQYQIKKESALNKIKATKENLNHVQAMLHELEPKLRFLSRQMKRLEQREESEKKLYEVQKKYFHTIWWKLTEQYTEQKEKLAINTKEILIHEKEQHVSEKLFHTVEKHDETDQDSDFSHIQKRYEEALKEKDRLISERSVVEARMRVLYEQSGEAHIPWLMKRKQEIEEALSTYNKELIALLSTYEKSEQNEKESLLKFEDVNEKILDYQKKRKERQEEELPSVLTHEDIVDTLEILYTLRQECEPPVSVQELFEKIFNLIQTIKTSLSKQQETHTQKDEFGDMERLFSQKDLMRSELQKIQTTIGIQKERIERVRGVLQKNTQELGDIKRDLTYFSSQTEKKKDTVLLQEKERITEDLRVREKELYESQEAIQAHYAAEKESRVTLVNLQKDMAMRQRVIEQLHHTQNGIQLELARIETHQEELTKKICEALHVDEQNFTSVFEFSHTPEQLNSDEAHNEIERLRRALEQIGTIDQEIIGEHTTTKERVDFLTKQMDDLTGAMRNIEKTLQELDTIIREKFDLSLEEINKKFQEYFHTLFHGGTARIIVQKREKEELSQNEDEKDIAESDDEVSGIDIAVTPPGKKLKNINVLSGGEKALTAISLLCAILSINPSPFVVLDEVDAALDESNAGRLASILQELSKKTQFIVITHNRVTTHIAHVLYGITMGEDGTSHMLSLDIGNIDAIVSQSGAV